MHWDYKDQLRQDRPGRRRRGLLRLRRRRPARAQGVGEGAGPHRRAHLPRRLRDLPQARRPIGANTATLERETLHVMDDKQRIALVETRTLDTAGNDPAPQQLIRYQFGNHLGSASLELDEQAQIISYEEYTPYGSTSYQAVRSQTETPKRYRYTGKERDEESGLYYHGARYYAPWLGRWTSCDSRIADSINLFAYVEADPVGLRDPNGAEEMCGVWDEQMQECRPEPCASEEPAASERSAFSSEWDWENAVSEPVSQSEPSRATPDSSSGITPPPNVRLLRTREPLMERNTTSEPPREPAAQSRPTSEADPLSAFDPLAMQQGLEFSRVGATRTEYFTSAARMSREVMQSVETGAMSTAEGAEAAWAGRRAIETTARQSFPVGPRRHLLREMSRYMGIRLVLPT